MFMMKAAKKPISFSKININPPNYTTPEHDARRFFCVSKFQCSFINEGLIVIIWAFGRAFHCNLFCYSSTTFQNNKKGFSFQSLTQNPASVHRNNS